jgi:prophage regulatory protein
MRQHGSMHAGGGASPFRSSVVVSEVVSVLKLARVNTGKHGMHGKTKKGCFETTGGRAKRAPNRIGRDARGFTPLYIYSPNTRILGKKKFWEKICRPMPCGCTVWDTYNTGWDSMSRDKDTFLRIKEVIRLTGMSRSAIYRSMECGGFPLQFKVGGGGFSARWSEVEVRAWMDLQKENR